MLLNKAACAVRHAAKTGKGTGPLNHVRITKSEAMATDGTVACKLTLPSYAKKHPLGLDGFTGPKLILKADLDLVDRVLPAGEGDDPREAALMTVDGAVVDGDRLVTLTFGSMNGEQPSLPMSDIDYPDVDAAIPGKRRGEMVFDLEVSALSKLLKVARAAGVEKLRFQVVGKTEEPVRVTGVVGSGGRAQMLTAAVAVCDDAGEGQQPDLPV